MDENRGSETSPNVGDVVEASPRLKTFYRFREQPTSSGVKSVLVRGSNNTATDVQVDWGILHGETVPLVALARNKPLSTKAAKDIAPNLAHWAKDKGIKRLLDMCSTSGDADTTETMNLDRRGRRKDVPVADFLDNLVSERVGKSVETVRSYRQRGARASRKNLG
jgi:hypothetical protein